MPEPFEGSCPKITALYCVGLIFISLVSNGIKENLRDVACEL